MNAKIILLQFICFTLILISCMLAIGVYKLINIQNNIEVIATQLWLDDIETIYID